MLGVLPDPLEWYVRPVQGRTNFTLFPWSGFVTAGAVVGLVLAARAGSATAPSRDRRHYARPDCCSPRGATQRRTCRPCTRHVNFWTSSPTFFFLRTGSPADRRGCCLGLGAAAAGADRWSPLVLLGVESLFVYWIHVEMVYGLLTWPLHRQLPLPWTVAAFAAFTAPDARGGRSEAPRAGSLAGAPARRPTHGVKGCRSP